MTAPISVNATLARLAELDGQPLELEGILLANDGGGYELLHYPNAERMASFEDGREYRAAIWIAFGNGSLLPNHAALARWSGKRVRIHGLLRAVTSQPAADSFHLGGFGPWGTFPAEIEAYVLQRVTAHERRENQ